MEQVLGILAALVVLWLFIRSLSWAFKDAECRGRDGCFVAFFVAIIGWPFSLLLWLVARPDRKGVSLPRERAP